MLFIAELPPAGAEEQLQHLVQKSGSGTAAVNFNFDNGLVLLMWEEWPVVAYYVINLIK